MSQQYADIKTQRNQRDKQINGLYPHQSQQYFCCNSTLCDFTETAGQNISDHDHQQYDRNRSPGDKHFTNQIAINYLHGEKSAR